MNPSSKFILFAIFNLPHARSIIKKALKIDFFQFGSLSIKRNFSHILVDLFKEESTCAFQEEFEQTLKLLPILAETYKMDEEDLIIIAAKKNDAKKSPPVLLKEKIPMSSTDRIIVEQGQEVHEKSGRTLFTAGLACCVAIGIYTEELYALAHDASELYSIYKAMRKKFVSQGVTEFEVMLVGGECGIEALVEIEQLIVLMYENHGEIPNCRLGLFDGFATASLEISKGKSPTYALDLEAASITADLHVTSPIRFSFGAEKPEQKLTLKRKTPDIEGEIMPELTDISAASSLEGASQESGQQLKTGQ